ncbi:cupin-like domain-containing protein [Parasphingopyxis marina]|uniref:Cupin-like domain-containing protein n=1 Tax=Parasphingopyxis marina TaxID=2761622 RepID=A0A842I070_9SPHN|nr:cupin-like domain-containing protein [Parasphingopyxis marina]MBC2777154.1 cupin-like domain-containing protein [Parasphingopyxis marina]
MAANPPTLSGLAPLRLSTQSASVMTEELRAEIADRLLQGQVPDDVSRWLSIKGLAPQIIREEMNIATRDPFYRGTIRLQQRQLKRDWQLSLFRRLVELDPAQQAVPVETAIAPEDFRSRYYAANRPALLKGVIDDWPAMMKWSLDYIEGLVSDGTVSVQWGREADPDYERSKAAFKRIMPFATVAERLRSGEPSNDYYVTASNDDENDALLAPLWKDIGSLPGILAPEKERDGFFWMGPQGTITPFHHDLTNNLLCQIAGRKRVKLVASWDAELMKNDRHCFSQWQGEELPAGPPKKNKPRVLEVVLEPGDALFLPVGWWHHVEALDFTIGMSFTNFAWPNDHAEDYRAFGNF